MKLKLTKPLIIGDKSIDELDLKFDELTGLDVLAAERKAVLDTAMPVIGHKTSGPFQLHLAAAACGIDASLLQGLPAGDFVRLLEAAQGFLVASG